MFGGIVARALDPRPAAGRLVELSDSFERADEHLEALIIFVARALDAPSDPNLAARIRLTFEEFNDRFPDSDVLTTISAESPAELIAALTAELRAGASLRIAFENDVANGRAPLAAIADAGGRSLVKVVACNVTLPMAYGDDGETSADLEGARAAVGMGAVLDAVSLTVVAGLPEDQRQALIEPLGQPKVAASTMLIATNAAAQLDDRDEQESLVLVDDQPTLIAHDPRRTRKERASTLGALAIARDQTDVVADYDPTSPDPYDDDLLEIDARAPALQGCVATISAARRGGLPVYSDDRHMRAMARSEGLQAFSTSALCAVLAARRILTDEQAKAIRLSLLAEGALGLGPTDGELLAAAAAAAWSPAAPWTQLLEDRVAWRADPARQFRLLDALLREIDRDRRDVLELWTARALNAFRRGSPEGRVPKAAAALVAMSWTTAGPANAEAQQRCVRLYRAIRVAPKLLRCGYFYQLLPDCLEYVFAYARGKPAANANAIVLHAFAHLPYDELATVLTAMAQASQPAAPPPPPPPPPRPKTRRKR